MQVVYRGQRSNAVPLLSGNVAPTVMLGQPAYVGMPVWLKVNTMFRDEIRYPSRPVAADFGCSQVEVRRNGLLLTPSMGARSGQFGVLTFSGNPCGWLSLPEELRVSGRLPLHLRYRFDEPGTYEVQYSRPDPFLKKTGPATVQDLSAWTSIEVLPARPDQRARWLEELRKRNPQDATELLTDVLPSVLGSTDQASLAFVANYLYHPDNLVREYAAFSLAYWPDEAASTTVLGLLFERGPSDALIDWLAWKHQGDPVSAEAIVRAALPSLESSSTIAMAGAIMAVNRFPAENAPPFREAFRQEIGAAMLRAKDHVLKLADAQMMIYFATALRR